jgi:hypothetical protein
MPEAPPAELARLARKYETLAALRRAREGGASPPEAAVFKALARQFPGCLNELDTLPLDIIDARAAALAAAATGGPTEPWMTWLWGYHALMRAALRIKPRVARGEALDEARAAALASDAAAHAGIAVDAAFARAVAQPPGGRLVAVVFARLEATHGCAAATIKRALFPAARR